MLRGVARPSNVLTEMTAKPTKREAEQAEFEAALDGFLKSLRESIMFLYHQVRAGSPEPKGGERKKR